MREIIFYLLAKATMKGDVFFNLFAKANCNERFDPVLSACSNSIVVPLSAMSLS